MPISGPKGAIPTLQGWVGPKGELLKCQRITQSQIDEWNGVKSSAPVSLTESPVTEEEFVAEHFEDANAEELAEEEVSTTSKRSSPKTNAFARAINRAKSKIGR